jgi:hypothetical protein
MSSKNTLRGSSLVELLVYITIFSIVSDSIWQAFIWFQKNHLNFTEQQQISFDIDHVYDLMSKDIANANVNDISLDNDCIHLTGGDGIAYYINSSILYKAKGCPNPDTNLVEPGSIALLKNIYLLNPRPSFFSIDPSSDSNYVKIHYSFEVRSNNKKCCETNRTIFSAISMR